MNRISDADIPSSAVTSAAADLSSPSPPPPPERLPRWYPKWRGRPAYYGNIEALGWGLDATGRAVVFIGLGAFLGTALLQSAKEAAGCDPDGPSCDATVYGIRPSSLLTTFSTIVGVISATFLPLMGAVVDYTSHRLAIGRWTSVLLTVMIVPSIFVSAETWFGLAILFLFMAIVGWMQTMVTYAYLPELTDSEERLTEYTKSFTMLNFGSMIVYLALIVGIATAAGFGEDTIATARFAVSVAFGVSCVTLYVAWFRCLKERPPARELPPDQSLWTAGFVQIYHTSIRIYREFPSLKWFYVSEMFSDAGVHALATIALTYITDTLNFTARETGITTICMLFGSLPGAWLTGPTIRWFNPVRSSMIGIFILMINTVVAAIILESPNQKVVVYVLAFVWGVGTGWKWTTDRLMASTLIPDGQDTELMGVFLFAGQVLTWLPPLIFTMLNESGVNPRVGIGIQSVFFLLAILSLHGVGNYEKAVATAGRMHRQPEKFSEALPDLPDGRWEYVGEGGKHALFSWCCTTPTTSRLTRSHLLLRLPKDEIALSSLDDLVEDKGNVRIICNSEGDGAKWTEAERYLRDVLIRGVPALHPYIDVPQPVKVPWILVRNLRLQTLSATAAAASTMMTKATIPSRRLQDWYLPSLGVPESPGSSNGDDDSGKQKVKNVSDTVRKRKGRFARGMLVRDYRQFYESDDIGGTSCGDFIDPGRAAATSDDDGDDDDDDDNNNNTDTPTATNTLTNSAANTIAIEIKPKAGYMAFSPLVCPSNRVKFRESRFVSLQRLYGRGLVAKAWDTSATEATVSGNNSGNNEVITSAYNPVDLFSGDPGRMSDAVGELFRCRQNNLRLWVNGRNVQDLGEAGQMMQQTRPLFAVGDYEFLNAAIVQVLLQENELLQTILRIQKLDILDGDGAVLVYRRMVQEILRSSIRSNEDWNPEDEAERLVDTLGQVSSCITPPVHELLDASPLVPPEGCSKGLANLCDYVQNFREHILHRGATSGAERDADRADGEASSLDEAHEIASRLVDALNAQDCRYLLQNWLLSLAFNDLSFFVTLRVDDKCTAARDDDDDGDRVRLAASRSRKQSATEPGIAVLLLPSLISKEEKSDVERGRDASSSSSHPVAVQYRIKLIDCDRKPASKLRNRGSKEEVFGKLSL